MRKFGCSLGLNIFASVLLYLWMCFFSLVFAQRYDLLDHRLSVNIPEKYECIQYTGKHNGSKDKFVKLFAGHIATIYSKGADVGTLYISCNDCDFVNDIEDFGSVDKMRELFSKNMNEALEKYSEWIWGEKDMCELYSSGVISCNGTYYHYFSVRGKKKYSGLSGIRFWTIRHSKLYWFDGLCDKKKEFKLQQMMDCVLANAEYKNFENNKVLRQSLPQTSSESVLDKMLIRGIAGGMLAMIFVLGRYAYWYIKDKFLKK